MSGLRTEASLLVAALADQVSALRAAVPDTPAAKECCAACGAELAGTRCSGCPWCTATAVLRGERPDLAATLLDGAITVLQALREAIEQPAAEPEPGNEQQQAATESAAVQSERIQVR